MPLPGHRRFRIKEHELAQGVRRDVNLHKTEVRGDWRKQKMVRVIKKGQTGLEDWEHSLLKEVELELTKGYSGDPHTQVTTPEEVWLELKPGRAKVEGPSKQFRESAAVLLHEGQKAGRPGLGFTLARESCTRRPDGLVVSRPLATKRTRGLAVNLTILLRHDLKGPSGEESKVKEVKGKLPPSAILALGSALGPEWEGLRSIYSEFRRKGKKANVRPAQLKPVTKAVEHAVSKELKGHFIPIEGCGHAPMATFMEPMSEEAFKKSLRRKSILDMKAKKLQGILPGYEGAPRRSNAG